MYYLRFETNPNLKSNFFIEYKINTIILQLEYNFGLRSALENREWEHIQYKTAEELENVRNIIGRYTLYGRRERLLHKIQGYYSLLNLNDNINYILADKDATSAFS